MLDNRGIEARHYCVWPGKNIPIFLEEGFIWGDFLRSASGSNDDFFDDAIFNGNVDFDGGGNVSHITFFKSIRGRNGIFEPIDRPGWDKIFGFDRVNGVLVRRHEGFLWKEECTMM
jgi:hypothetical protein